MTAVFQGMAPSSYVYPLPLNAEGMRGDLPFERREVIPFARCETTVLAQVSKIKRTPNGIDLTFEILDGDCEHGRALCGGNGIVCELDFSNGPQHQLATQNLQQLLLATGVSLSHMKSVDEIKFRPFLMSIAVPC
ncbi:hypothetical protein [Mesorhizobium sp. CN2-181]|uniref:hypothetical protein n=1 Tax=Mesorhizobium yinganensis TaxID=3157707 RepID=UPI0032B70559